MSGLVERATIGVGAASRGRRVVAIKRLLAALAVTLGLIAAATFGVRYWEVGRFQVETDDAYVQADSIIIAPRVPGYVAEVPVNDNQPVKAGQVLARIDDRDLRTALDQAGADRQAAEHKVANLSAQLQLQQSLIDEAAAQVASAEAAATFAAQDQRRYSDLAHTGAGNIQQAQQTQALLLQRTADLQRAHAALTTARRQVEVLRTAEAEASPLNMPVRSSSRRA
jgi:membrane fusion protein, multidrug efflux system